MAVSRSLPAVFGRLVGQSTASPSCKSQSELESVRQMVAAAVGSNVSRREYDA